MDLKYGDRPRGNILGAFLARRAPRPARSRFAHRNAPSPPRQPLLSLPLFVRSLLRDLSIRARSVRFPRARQRIPRRIPRKRAVNANAGHTQYQLDLLVSVVSLTKLFI